MTSNVVYLNILFWEGELLSEILMCIPNVSEGRDEAILCKLAEMLKQIPGCALLNWSADPDHNRSVYTITGSAKALEEAAVSLCQGTRDLIDLRAHAGVHPRIGALDVLPFVPLQESDMPLCVDLARKTASRIAKELNVPCYLYDQAAFSPCTLPEIRKGGWDGLKSKKPDFGTDFIHPSAGATAVGARKPLLAFNICLQSQDLALAKQIAKSIRKLPGIRALGLWLPTQKMVQVSINFVDTKQTGILTVLDTVTELASQAGVAVAGCELIGMAQASVLMECATRALNLIAAPSPTWVLEDAVLSSILEGKI
jgi:glutamate formiminotransferase